MIRAFGSTAKHTSPHLVFARYIQRSCVVWGPKKPPPFGASKKRTTSANPAKPKPQKPPPSPSTSDDALVAEIQQRVSLYKRQLRKHFQASLKHRQLQTQINNLQEAIASNTMRKGENTLPEPVPSRITLEILSSGTCNMEPSVLIRTPTRGYLINCPESTSRMLPGLNLRANNITDILVTSCNIRRIGGVSGFMLSQSRGVAPTRIHGPPFIRNYLEFLRPFADAEFGEVKYPGTVVEQPYDAGPFKDVTLTINYLPLHNLKATSSLSSTTKSRADSFSVAFLIETNPGIPKIDMAKIMGLKVPKGPLIGKLKNGETITLPDGRKIQPSDVYADGENEGLKNAVILVVDATDPEQVASLESASVLQPFISGKKTLDYIVHFTADEVMKSPGYDAFSARFDPKVTKQLIVNGFGKADPHLESVYRTQAVHSTIDPEMFPALCPAFNGLINESSEKPLDDKNRIIARPMQRFVLRGPEQKRSEDCTVDLRHETNPLFEKIKSGDLVEYYNSMIPAAPATSEPFPKITFLGTSSAVPSKYRNVTSIMIQTPMNNYLLDCGEGTYGQLLQIFGSSRIDEFLTNLRVVFMTHTHQDHTNGLVTLLQERARAVSESGNISKLIVVCNRNIVKHMHTFTQRFYDVTEFAHFVVPHIYGPDRRPIQADITQLLEHNKLLHCMPDLEAAAVKVNHTSDAVGYILTTKIGDTRRKLVFSGDTTPCDFLIECGQGADVLIHEGTFEDDYESDARHKKHSTMIQAVNVGLAMKAKHIILTHFSARYPKVPPLPAYIDEHSIGIAMDNLTVSMDNISRLPALNHVYRKLYDDELFEIERKAQQRSLRPEYTGPPAKKRAVAGGDAAAEKVNS
uniref:ribonuclease Z n=1 Tax=Panagrellus redivivus TaxID=6233 RepID=A0A7E4VR65_PANRE